MRGRFGGLLRGVLTLLISALWINQAGAQTGPRAAEPDGRRDVVAAETRVYGAELRADRGSECSVGVQTSLPNDVTARPCTWERSTPFSLDWSAREVRLTVGRTTIRRAGQWLLGNAIHLAATGGARLTITRIEDEWNQTVVAGDPATVTPVDAWITANTLADGWRISGVIERPRPTSADKVTVTVGQVPNIADSRSTKPPAFTGGIAGLYSASAPGAVPPLRSSSPQPSAGARVLNWTGAVNGQWSNPGNWSPAGPPASQDQLVFGSSAQSRSMTNDVPGLVLDSITIQGGGYALAGPLAANSLVINAGATETFAFTGVGRSVSSTTVNSGRLLLGGSLGEVILAGGTLATQDGSSMANIPGSAGELGSAGFSSGVVDLGSGTKTGLRLSNSMTFVVSICDGRVQTWRVNGDVNVNSATLSIVLCPGYEPNVNDLFVVIDNDATDPVNGKFRGSQTVTVGNVTFNVDYAGGSGGNDLVLGAIAKGPASAPDLAITKTHSPGTFQVGGNGTYTLTVGNTGNAATSGVVTVTDTLPAGFAPLTMSGTGWNCALATASCTRSDSLPAGSAYPPIQLTVVVSTSLPGGTYQNTAAASGGGDATAATVTDSTPVAGGVDLKITKVRAEHLVRGQQGTFTLQVRNVSSVTAAGPMTVTDVIGDGAVAVSYTSSDWVCTIAPGGRQVSCTRSAALPPTGGTDLHSDINVVVQVALTAPAEVVNTATVSASSSDTDVDLSNNSTSISTPVVTVQEPLGAPDVAITKSHEGSFVAGGTARFSITLQNVGDAPTPGRIQVRDVLPAGLTPQSTSGTGWSCSISGQVVQCDYNLVLAAHSQPSAPLLIDATVASDATGDTNQADVTAVGDGNARNDAALDTYVVAGTPQLLLSKSHTGDFVQGQIGATYRLTVTNSGRGPTTGSITLADSLPAALTPTSAEGAGWTCSIQAQLVTCTRGTAMVAQEISVVTLTVTVSDLANSAVNTATLSGGGDPTPHQASDPTTILGRPQLTIAKSHADPVLKGQQGVQFTIGVLNNGTNQTTGSVTVTDTLPAGLLPVDATGGGWSCGIAGQTVTCSRNDSLQTGQTYAQIYVSVNVAADANSVTNTATVSGGGDTTPDDNTASDLVAISTPNTPNLVLSKSHESDFAQGQTGASYRVRIDNRGSAASTGAVTVTDDLPAGLSPTTATGTGWNCGIAGQRVTCTRADALAPGASWPVIQIAVDVSPTATDLVNTATVTGGGDTTPGDSSASDSTTITPAAPDLRIIKRHTDPFIGGQNGAAYRITITNAGTASTFGEITVRDNVPPGLTLTGASGSGWQCEQAAPVATCRRSDPLAPGSSYPDIVLLVNVSPSASTVANVATVSGGGDPTPENSAADVTNINASLDAAIDLFFASDLLVGRDGQLVAQVTNVGPGTIGTGTVVVINLPPELVPISGGGSGWQCRRTGNQFVCTQADILSPGERFPDIRLRVRVSVAEARVAVSAVVTAINDSNDTNDRAEIITASTVPAASLTIRKVASAQHVVVGGSLTYRVEIRNDGDAAVADAMVRDLLPRGFRYAEPESDVRSTTRSARLVRATGGQDELSWTLGTLSSGETVNLTYRVIVGADAGSGPQDNRASVSGIGPDGAIVSAGPAIATVEVIRDVFSTLQAVVGRVFEDKDGDGVFTRADRPIANARVITSAGQAAITDPDGLYNIPSLGAGSVALLLDRATLPGHLTISDNDPGERSWSRLLRTPAGGGTVLTQNFALVPAAGRTAEQPAEVVLTSQPAVPAPAVTPEKDPGVLPPRREYESRMGSSVLLALGEVSFGKAAPEFDVFKKDGDAWGYGSVFLQTPVVSSKTRLTVAFDTHRRLNGTTDQNRLFELDPNDRLYPVFGDTSRRQEFATSNSKFFGRLEHGTSYVMYGDLLGDLPASSQDGGRWSSYQRHLTGTEGRLANEKGDGVTVRGAQPSTSYARDVFSGTLPGLLALSHTNVRQGTETIAVEVRDRRAPERVLSREVLARAVDYELNPLVGAIFLRRHIGGVDSALNLVQVVATYEYENTGLENMVFSGRGTWGFKGLRLGGTLFTEEGETDDRFTVAGFDLDQALPHNGRLMLELPYSHGTPRVATAVDFRNVGSPAETDGFGIRATLDQPVSAWDGRITGRVLGANQRFQNPFSSTITPGATFVEGRGEFSPRKPSRFRVGATFENYDSVTVDADRTTLSASWTETLMSHLSLTGGYDQRWLDQHSVSTTSGLFTAGARVTVGSRFEASAFREQNVRDETDPTYPDQTMLGARFRIGSQSSLFYTQRISDDAIVPVGDFTGTGFYALPTTSELSFGVESRVADATQVTSRYEIAQGVNGPDAFALIGVMTEIHLGKGFASTLGGDWGKSVEGSSRDYKSGTLGISYRAADRLAATARYEARDRQGFSSLLSAGVATRVSGGITGLVRGEWLNSGIALQPGDSLSFLWALAIRPATNDRAGLLFSYQYVDRGAPVQAISPASRTLDWQQRLSTDGYLQPMRRLELHGKVAWLETNDPIQPVGTYLAQGRVRITIQKRVDAALEARYMRQAFTSSSRTGTSAEAGFWVIPDVRFGIGYSFDDSRDPLQRDLEGRAQGAYFTISTKLSRLFDLMGSAPPPTSSASGRQAGDRK